MENCLKTQLKAIVENNNLNYLGYVKARVKITTEGAGATLKFSKNETVILLDATWITGGGRSKNVSANTSFPINSATVTPDSVGAQYCSVLIPKYSCYYYQMLYPYEVGGVFEASGFEYGSADEASEIRIAFDNCGIVSGLPDAPLSKAAFFTFASTTIKEGELDLTQLGAGGGLKTFYCNNFTKATGTLDNLGKSNVTSLGTFPNTKNVSIDIVNYVNNHRAAGRASGTVNLQYVGLITVKANGVVLDVPSEATNTLTWTADSITFRGEPIS